MSTANWTGRPVRTMQEAFGPYTSSTLHPMPDQRQSGTAADWVTVAIGLAFIAAVVASCCGWINFTGA